MTNLCDQSLKASVQHQLPVVRNGIAATLRSHPDIQVVSEREQADVIVTDYEHGLRLASQSAMSMGNARLLIVAGTAGETDIRTAHSVGIAGYVLYDCTPNELTSAVVTLAGGGRHFCARAAQRMTDSLKYEELTPRELDVLSLMIRGLSNKLIAGELKITTGTVKAHAKVIFSKLRADSRLHAVAVAVARGIGSPMRLEPVPEPRRSAIRHVEHDYARAVADFS